MPSGVVDLRQKNHAPSSEIRSNIENVPFCQYAWVVDTFTDGDGNTLRCDVRLADKTCDGQEKRVNGVELVFGGTAKIGLRYPVEVGDCVLLVATMTDVATSEFDRQPADETVGYLPYSYQTVKAIPIQPNEVTESRTLIKATDNAVEITTSRGVALDVNGGKIKISADTDGNLEITADKVSINGGHLTVE